MNKKGFTLIELLIVIAIIGIIAAIAIPNLLTALQKGKQKATMGDMKSIGTAVESYMTDLYMAPTSSSGTVGGLNAFLEPFYIKVLPEKDGWGGSYAYASGSAGTEQQDLYSVISYGRGSSSDGLTIANSPYVVNSMDDFGNDICYSNGNFTYVPRVK